MNAAIWVLAVGVLGLIIFGAPIGFALTLGTMAGQLVRGQSSLLLVPTRMFHGAINFPLVAIPLFVLAGQIMNDSGISRRLIAFASSLVGFIRGGLCHVTIVTSMFFAEMSGSAVADAAALGTVLIPAMEKKGYPTPFAATVVSSAATIAIIIPPSIPMILYAVSAEVSISQMFLAGIIPGILFGVALMVISYIMARVRHYPIEQKFELGEIWHSFKGAVWSFLVPLVILGGIFTGIFTATEAAGVAVIVAILIGKYIHREYDWKRVPHALLDGALQAAVVMLIVAASEYMASFFSSEQVPQRLAAAILGYSKSPVVILLILNVLLLIVGMFLHSSAAIVTLTPIIMPLIRAVGIDPVHFGIVMTVNLGIGQQTPPVASVLLTCISIAKTTIAQVLKVLPYFLAAMIAILLLITYVPSISLVVPHLLGH